MEPPSKKHKPDRPPARDLTCSIVSIDQALGTVTLRVHGSDDAAPQLQVPRSSMPTLNPYAAFTCRSTNDSVVFTSAENTFESGTTLASALSHACQLAPWLDTDPSLISEKIGAESAGAIFTDQAQLLCLRAAELPDLFRLSMALFRDLFRCREYYRSIGLIGHWTKKTPTDSWFQRLWDPAVGINDILFDPYECQLNLADPNVVAEKRAELLSLKGSTTPSDSDNEEMRVFLNANRAFANMDTIAVDKAFYRMTGSTAANWRAVLEYLINIRALEVVEKNQENAILVPPRVMSLCRSIHNIIHGERKSNYTLHGGNPVHLQGVLAHANPDRTVVISPTRASGLYVCMNMWIPFWPVSNSNSLERFKAEILPKCDTFVFTDLHLLDLPQFQAYLQAIHEAGRGVRVHLCGLARGLWRQWLLAAAWKMPPLPITAVLVGNAITARQYVDDSVTLDAVTWDGTDFAKVAAMVEAGFAGAKKPLLLFEQESDMTKIMSTPRLRARFSPNLLARGDLMVEADGGRRRLESISILDKDVERVSLSEHEPCLVNYRLQNDLPSVVSNLALEPIRPSQFGCIDRCRFTPVDNVVAVFTVANRGFQTSHLRMLAYMATRSLRLIIPAGKEKRPCINTDVPPFNLCAKLSVESNDDDDVLVEDDNDDD